MHLCRDASGCESALASLIQQHDDADFGPYSQACSINFGWWWALPIGLLGTSLVMSVLMMLNRALYFVRRVPLDASEEHRNQAALLSQTTSGDE